MRALLEVTTIELMELWGELVEAYNGCNKFGGNTAEIYAYRLMPYSPSAHDSGDEKRRNELNNMAADALVELCEVFMGKRSCDIEINGLAVVRWRNAIGNDFSHRAHVTVRP